MFRAYLNEPALYAASFREGWYLSGDLVEMDPEGWLAWIGRADDVFKAAGHLVSPAEVEAVLLEHPAVVDAAVRGRENATAGLVVEAWVVLAEGVEASGACQLDILRFARDQLGPALAPRALHVRDALPRTSSGKILRKELD
jgi:acetyl-CoA synthetase